MGWLHSVDDGSGIYLNKLSMTEIYDNLEKLNIDLSDENIKKIYPELKIDLSKFSYKEKVLLLGMGKENPHSWYDYNIKSINQITPDYIEKDVVKDDYWFDIVICDSLSILFSLKYNYPHQAFKSLMDYNGDYMFYCAARFPIKEGFEDLTRLTEKIYIQQINEFFGLLVSKWKNINTLDECEEFIKE